MLPDETGGLLDAGRTAVLPDSQLRPAREPPSTDAERRRDCSTQPATSSTIVDGSVGGRPVVVDATTDVDGRELTTVITDVPRVDDELLAVDMISRGREKQLATRAKKRAFAASEHRRRQLRC